MDDFIGNKEQKEKGTFHNLHTHPLFFPLPPDDKGEIKVVVGFVPLYVSPLHEYEAFNKLSKLHEAIEVHPLFGEYDIIAKIEAKDYESIGQIVIHKIKTINGITDTTTLTGIKLH